MPFTAPDPFNVEARIDACEAYLFSTGATDWATRPLLAGPLNIAIPNDCILCRIDSTPHQRVSYLDALTRRRLTYEDAVAFGLCAHRAAVRGPVEEEYAALNAGWTRRRDMRRAETGGYKNAA